MHNSCYRSLKNRDGKVYKKCEMRHQRVKCSDYSVCLSNFNDVTVELLKKEEAIYHLDFYKLETNKTFIDRLRKRPEAHRNALALDRDNCNVKEVEIVEKGEIFSLKVQDLIRQNVSSVKRGEVN